MASVSTFSLAAGAASLGVLSHLGLYIRGEWHMQAPLLVKLYASLVLGAVSISVYLGNGPASAVRYTSIAAAAYSTGLFGSIIVYRKLFHRLRRFPGPWLAGATKFWHVWQCRRGQNYLVIEKLRARYGPIIRTGPEELTIVDPSVPLAVDGPGNHCSKAVWYDFLLPELAVNTTRSIADHAKRRRIWDRGFSPKALAVYENRVFAYAERLASRIEQLAVQGSPVNVTDWFHWFTFDVMGEFAFASSFDMLVDEKWHFAPRLLRRAMSLLGPFSPVPWLGQIAFYIVPWMYVVRDWLSLVQWCKDRMRERIQMKGVLPDVAHWLIDASLKRGSLEADRDWLNGDAFTIIIAGSDTVATTLVFGFYELARNPPHQEKLLSELDGIDIYDRATLQACDHLTAVINETLRLHPPVPTGGYRQTPPGGMTVAGVHVPGNVTIVAPRYSLARLATAYADPERWVPERWTTRPDMVRDARAFAPFGLGRFGCVGRNLAMSEMRFVFALLVTRFRVGFAPGEDGESLFANLRDHFTAAPGRLRLQFSLRE